MITIFVPMILVLQTALNLHVILFLFLAMTRMLVPWTFAILVVDVITHIFLVMMEMLAQMTHAIL